MQGHCLTLILSTCHEILSSELILCYLTPPIIIAFMLITSQGFVTGVRTLRYNDK